MATAIDIARRLEGLSTGGLMGAVTSSAKAFIEDAESRARANARQRLRRRTGRLEESIVGGVGTEGHTVTAFLTAGSRSVPYAAIHEVGGTILPKRGRYLAIPLSKRVEGTMPRHAKLENTFVIEVRGRPFIVQKQGSKLEFLWLLVRSTTIEAKYYMRDAFHDAVANARRTVGPEVAAMLSGTETSSTFRRVR